MIKVFVSKHDDEMSLEYAEIKRVLQSLLPVTWADFVGESALFVGVFGQRLHPQSVTDFDQAIKRNIPCLLFVKATQERSAELTRLMGHVQDVYPTYTFHDVAQLRQEVAASLRQRHLLNQGDKWQAPPLPLRPLHFVGRGEVLARMGTLLNSILPVVLTGESGLGKTALALEFAYQARERYPAGIFWLREGRLEAALRVLAQAHPVGRASLAAGTKPQASEVRAWLGMGGKGLVIVDAPPTPDFLLELRAALPSPFSLLILSDKEPESFNGHPLPLAPLTVEERLDLLQSVLALPSRLADEVLRPLRGIAEVLGGSPLILHLAAQWMLRAGGWQSALLYLNRLSEAPPRLLPASIQPEGLEKAFGLLYNSLNSREKALFRALGAFAPSEPFSLEALLMVAGKVGAGRDLRDLGRLWLFADELSGEVRAHPQIAEIAQRLLSSQADEQVVFARHLTYYERWAAKHPSESSWLGQARHAHAYVLRAWPERAVAFTLNIGQALLLQNQTTELRAWLEATLRYKAALEKGQAPDLRALGDLCVKIGYHQAAQEYYELALLLYYESKSLSGQANTLKALGDLRASENHHAEAQDYYDRTLLLYAQIDFQLGRANTLKALGDLSLQKMNDLKAARNYYNRALALYEQIDFQLGQAQTFQAMGEVHVRERDYAAAKQSYQTALAFYRDIHFHSQEAATLLSLGQLYAETNALEAAYHAFEEALERYRQLDDKDGQLEALSAQGRLWLTQRHYEKAQESYQQARALAQAKHDLRGVAGLDNTLAGLYVAQGYPELALRAWLAALEGFTQLEDKAEISHVQRQLREMAQRMGKDFARVWRAVAQEQDLPDWLKLAPASPLPKRLVYAVRDFVLLQDSYAQQRAVEENADLLLTDEADEVFASMLRQYAGQTAPARQIDRYRALLQRCRQIGIVPAFEEYRTPSTSEHEGQVARLRQTLDAYDQALLRLRDIPLVYASVQLSRASTLRELADLPQQDRRSCLEQALQAYDDALSHQTSAPLDYAQTQIQRAAVLRELGELPDADLRQSLLATLAAYEDALPHQQDLPSELAKTQLLRAQTLQALAKQKDEDALARYQEALAAYEQVLSVLQDNPLEVARTQSSRALLLYELAGLPGQDFRARMTEALAAYDEALESLRDQDPLEYAKTQSQCVALLRDMAGLPGEDRRARLYQALASSNEGLRYIANAPDFYATAQINRAHLLREIAGLSGEHRLARLREALATYNDALAHVAEAPFEYAGVQNSRATLLREIAAMSGRDSAKRLRDSLEAVTEVLIIMGRLDPQDAQYKTAQRTFISTRQEIYQQLGEEIFLEWWKSASGGAPLPAWALE